MIAPLTPPSCQSASPPSPLYKAGGGCRCLPERKTLLAKTSSFLPSQYPVEIRKYEYDPNFAIRGLHYDVHRVGGIPGFPAVPWSSKGKWSLMRRCSWCHCLTNR